MPIESNRIESTISIDDAVEIYLLNSLMCGRAAVDDREFFHLIRIGTIDFFAIWMQ